MSVSIEFQAQLNPVVPGRIRILLLSSLPFLWLTFILRQDYLGVSESGRPPFSRVTCSEELMPYILPPHINTETGSHQADSSKESLNRR